MFIQELLGLVDLGREVRTSASVGVVEEHELTMLFADFILVQGSFTANVSCLSVFVFESRLMGKRTGVPGSARLPDGSCAVQTPFTR